MEWYVWALIIIVLLYIASWIRLQYDTPKKTDGKKIVLYYRDGCPPCDAMKADWRKFADKMFVATEGYSIEGDAGRDLAAKNKIAGTPTIIVYQNDVEVYRKSGSHTYADLMKLLQI